MKHNRLNLNDDDKPRDKRNRNDGGGDFLQIPFSQEFEEKGSIHDPGFSGQPTMLKVSALLDQKGDSHLEINMCPATSLQQLKLSAILINRLVVQWQERLEKNPPNLNPTGEALRDSMALIELTSEEILKFLKSVVGNAIDNGDIHNK